MAHSLLYLIPAFLVVSLIGFVSTFFVADLAALRDLLMISSAALGLLTAWIVLLRYGKK